MVLHLATVVICLLSGFVLQKPRRGGMCSAMDLEHVRKRPSWAMLSRLMVLRQRKPRTVRKSSRASGYVETRWGLGKLYPVQQETRWGLGKLFAENPRPSHCRNYRRHGF